MIEFVTLLLGLVTGLHPVEIAVGPGIAKVEWRLDGRTVAERSAPPWKAAVQFGGQLRPRRLTVIGFDRNGLPVAKAEQMINYIRATHEVVVVLEAEESGKTVSSRRPPPSGGRIVSQGVLGRRPASFALRFDGRELPVAADGRFELPDYDTERPHAVEAEVTFTDGILARTETTFGGGIGDEVTSALSAFAVVHPRGKPWSEDDVQGWLRRDGLELPVFRVQAEGGQVVVVRDEGVGINVLRNILAAPEIDRGSDLDHDYRLAVVDPVPIVDPGVTFRVHPLGAVRSKSGLLQALSVPSESYGFTAPRDAPQDVWSALATAGREAAASRRPRVVVLMIAEDTDPATTFTPEAVLSYLRSVHVPLAVWAPTRRALKRLGLNDSKLAWAGPRGLATVVHQAFTLLDSQTMIWVEGEHLPTEVQLVPDHKKAGFVGAGEK